MQRFERHNVPLVAHLLKQSNFIGLHISSSRSSKYTNNYDDD